MNTPAVDPELTLFSRFLRFLLPEAAPLAGPVLVRIGRNAWGGFSLFPANAAARDLMGGDEPTGNFATEADARKRIAWNCWDEAGEAEPHIPNPPHAPLAPGRIIRQEPRQAA